MLAVDGVLLNSRAQIWLPPSLGPQHDQTSPGQATFTIMVVDDDERGLGLTSRMLRDEGYEVIEARSAEQALKQLADAGAVHVVLTDIVMPGMSGVELAEKVQAAGPLPRVVLMSGYDRIFPRWEEMGARFPLLVKPFTPDQLIRQMREVLKGNMH
jgi:DNA-binding NtrC family response regulator